MKKKISLLLVLCILNLFVCAAEQTNAAETALASNVSVEIDLNGDGEKETLSWKTEKFDEYDDCVIIEVTKAGGTNSAWKSERLINPQVYAKDINGDGTVELFVSGDEMSDDYVTFCLNYVGDAFHPVFFADASRGEITNAYYKGGYGKIVAINKNSVTLRGTQDMLGTYMSDRTFSLSNGCFELLDDGIWYVAEDESDEDRWEYKSLTLTRDIQISFITDNGKETGQLSAGEKILVTASDKTNFIWIRTQDGRHGMLEIEPDMDSGYALIVNGIPENELFESIPYAG